MTFLKQLRTKADQVTLEADKALRINRKQGEMGQIRKQIEQQLAHLGAIAYGLHKQGQGLAPDLQLVCEQIDGLYVLIQQAEQEIERIRQEGLPVEISTIGVHCSVCSAAIPETAAFCPNCGSPRPKPSSSITCASCGNVIPADARFCADCGQPVAAPAPPASPPVFTEAPPATFPSSSAPSETSELRAADPAPEDTLWLAMAEEPPASAATVCSNCQAEIPAAAAFCPICGTPTQQA